MKMNIPTPTDSPRTWRDYCLYRAMSSDQEYRRTGDVEWHGSAERWVRIAHQFAFNEAIRRLKEAR